MNVMNLLVAKLIAERQGVPEKRALELAFVASTMPTMQGILITSILAQREAPTPPTKTSTGTTTTPCEKKP